jgi:putative FmdB family regulatory protein
VPIYEYTCEKCSKRFEQLVRSMNSEQSFRCPACGSEKTSRSLSLFAVGGESGAKSATEAPPMCGRCGGEPRCAGV